MAIPPDEVEVLKYLQRLHGTMMAHYAVTGRNARSDMTAKQFFSSVEYVLLTTCEKPRGGEQWDNRRRQQ